MTGAPCCDAHTQDTRRFSRNREDLNRDLSELNCSFVGNVQQPQRAPWAVVIIPQAIKSEPGMMSLPQTAN